MKKILALIIGILLGNVGVLLWIVLSGSLIEMDSNKVVIYSGLLGFSGAIVAVVGTYFISMNQTTKQLKHQEDSRKIELKIKRIQEIIMHFNEIRSNCLELIELLKSTKGTELIELKENQFIYVKEMKKEQSNFYKYIDLFEEYKMEDYSVIKNLYYALLELNKFIENNQDGNNDEDISGHLDIILNTSNNWISRLTEELVRLTRIKI